MAIFKRWKDSGGKRLSTDETLIYSGEPPASAYSSGVGSGGTLSMPGTYVWALK